jgi:hypothetical protein
MVKDKLDNAYRSLVSTVLYSAEVCLWVGNACPNVIGTVVTWMRK